MSRVRNANDFLKRFIQARGHYEKHYRPRVEEVRAKYKQNDEIDPLDIDNILEAQLREYFIDSFLGALNWRFDKNKGDELPNLIPEAQIQSIESGNTRFLDYLGLTKDDKPLLIVETKRPNSLLPKKVEISGKSNIYPSIKETIKSAICAGLRGDSLSGDWNAWLKTLKDYVVSVEAKGNSVPRRVVLTNGTWLIIFTDPADSFLSKGTHQADNILIYEEKDDIEKNYQEIYGWLEHQRVLNETPPLTVGEVTFYITAEDVAQILHGLKLKYIEDPGFLKNSPRIKVMPILFLRSQNGAWLLVESRTEHEIPFEIEKISEHLDSVHKIAIELLNKVTGNLSINIIPTTVEEHFEDEEAFDILRGVTYEKIKTHPEHEQYLIITGQHTHYFHLEPTISGCLHHDWGASNQKGCAALITIQSRSVDPRSFFITGEKQHCNHFDVERAKSEKITPENKNRCGLRSGENFDPFCEIWSFETRLCCRTCIYENVCTKAQVFNLPCA